MTGYEDEQLRKEINLFRTLDKKEALGFPEEEIDAWWDREMVKLTAWDKDAQWRYEINLPWWERFIRWLRYQIRQLRYRFFPPVRDADRPTVVTNPVGHIPVLGAIFGFGMELAAPFRPDLQVESGVSGFGTLFSGLDFVVSNLPTIAVGAAVLSAIVGAIKIVRWIT
jgi:hypothetical protein